MASSSRRPAEASSAIIEARENSAPRLIGSIQRSPPTVRISSDPVSARPGLPATPMIPMLREQAKESASRTGEPSDPVGPAPQHRQNADDAARDVSATVSAEPLVAAITRSSRSSNRSQPTIAISLSLWTQRDDLVRFPHGR